MSYVRSLLLGGLAALLIAVAVLALRGGDESYHAVVQLTNASGLREGSVVQTGGVDVGKIGSFRLDDQDRVEAVLDIDPDKTQIGAGAEVQIKAKNLLGEKYLQISPGNRRDLQPSGVVIPASRVTVPVDLDQVLDVLDADTRTKLTILINEAGGSLMNRGQDLNSLLNQLPSSFDAASRVVDQVVSDNETLGKLIDRTDSFMATFAPQRAQLTQVISAAGKTAETVAARNARLRETLAAAPATLRTLRGFLSDLEATTTPLGPAARLLARTAPSLSATLDQVPAFQKAAVPTLNQALDVAPELTRLGKRATPVLRRAEPTVDSLATFAMALQPVSRTLDLTIDDLLATIHGWDRAIQGRDGLSHIFRAKLGFSVDTLRAVLGRFGPAKPGTKTTTTITKKAAAPVEKPSVDKALDGLLTPKPASPLKVPGDQRVTDTVQNLLDSLLKP